MKMWDATELREACLVGGLQDEWNNLCKAANELFVIDFERGIALSTNQNISFLDARYKDVFKKYHDAFISIQNRFEADLSDISIMDIYLACRA